MILHKAHTHKADIYSYGIVVWKIMHREMLYEPLATSIKEEWAINSEKALRGAANALVTI